MPKHRNKGKKHKPSKLTILEKKFKQVYKSWGEKTFCPSLEEDVFFTDTGWNHITEGTRSKADIETRLKLLPLAKRLIQEFPHKPIIEYRNYKGKTTKYWKLKGVLDNNEIAVIIIRVSPGKFIFLSDQDVWDK